MRYLTGSKLTADSSHHISNAVSLLLRVALFDREGQAQMTHEAVECIIAFVDSLVRTFGDTQWDIAESALRRIAIVLLVGSRELPVLAETYRTVADVLRLNMPRMCWGPPRVVGVSLNCSLRPASTEHGTSTDQLLESLGLGTGNMAHWLDTDLSWLDSTILLSAYDAGSGE